MASFNSSANSESKQPIAPVLQKFWSKQSELSEQKPTTEGVRQAKKYVKVTNNNQSTNECSVQISKNNEEDKPVQLGKIQLPEKFQQNQKSVTEVTKASPCEKKPIKFIKQISKQETEDHSIGAGSKTTSDVEQPSKMKSALVQDQSSKLSLREHNLNSSTQEQESTDLNVFQQKINGKKFRKVTMRFDYSSLPKPPKKIDIDLSTIRLQYQKAVSNHKEDSQEDDVYVIDVEAMIAEEQRKSPNKTCYKDITSNFSAKVGAEDIYDDGFTPSPVCVPDDSLYLEAVTVPMRKSLTNQKEAIEQDDDNIYDMADT